MRAGATAKAGATAEALVEAATRGRRRWVTAATGLGLALMVVLAVRACQPDAGPAAFCAEIQRVGAIRTAEQLQGQGGQATLADLRSSLNRLRERSPGAVRGDVATLADVTRRLHDALDQQDRGSQAERDRATADLDAGLAAFEQASARVVDYAQRTCGLDLDG